MGRYVGRLAVLLAIALALGAAPVRADEDGGDAESHSFKEAFTKGTLSALLRYRFEFVDQDGFENDAKASTLRATLGYRTLPWHHVSLFVEFETVQAIGDDDSYNNLGDKDLHNGVTDHPVVADPELTQVNQGYLQLDFTDTVVRIGREGINLDDQRFVGTVGWRQNDQTFDGITLQNTSVPDSTISYAFVDNVNNIFGGHRGMTSHLLHGDFGLSKVGRLNVFGYWLDYDDLDQSGASTATWGARLNGSPALGGDWKLIYDAVFASQSDTGDNPASVDATYYRAELGARVPAIWFKAGQEMLSGDEDGKFITPLATLHKFNGWSDKFLGTPATGLVDTYLKVGGKHSALGWTVAYHDFASDSASLDYGTEIDAQVTYKSSWEQLFGLKGAAYDADTHSVDTTKIWFFTQYKF